MQNCHFDNSLIRGWGHEDTLFAYTLKNRGYRIIHIDNPIVHQGYISNEKFICQMDQGLINLMRIYKSRQHEDLIHDFRTTHLLRSLEKWKLLFLLNIFYSIIKKPILNNIRSSKPKLFYFDIYKIGTLSKLISKN